MIWLAIIGYLACSVEVYLVLRASLRRCTSGWTCGDRLFGVIVAAFGPIALLVAILTAGIFDNDKPARW